MLENDLVHSEAARRQAQQELDRAGESDSQLNTRIQEQRQQIAGRQEQAGQLREQQQELKVRQQAVSQEQNGLDAKVEALKERRFALNQSLNETKLSSASGATLIQESLSRLEALRENAVVKDGNIARLEGECADCRDLLHQLEDTLRSLGNSRDGLRLKQQGRREKLDRLARDCQQLEDRARERLQRAKVLFDMENSLEGFSGSVQQQAHPRHAAPGILGSDFIQQACLLVDLQLLIQLPRAPLLYPLPFIAQQHQEACLLRIGSIPAAQRLPGGGYLFVKVPKLLTAAPLPVVMESCLEGFRPAAVLSEPITRCRRRKSAVEALRLRWGISAVKGDGVHDMLPERPTHLLRQSTDVRKK